MASDEQLIVRVAEGEAAALEELLRRYERGLAAFIDRRTGGHDVEDLYQETWLRVLRAAGRFDRTRRFSTWLFHIATNLCRDWWRRGPIEPAGSASEMLVEEVARDERAEAAMTAQALLSKLSDSQREAIILRYYHDLSEAEMSEVLACPRGTVKSRLHSAIARLAQLAGQEARE